MQLTKIIEAMVLNGCTGEQIFAVVKTHEDELKVKLEERRVKARDKKRRQRAMSPLVPDCPPVVPGTDRDLSLPSPPLNGSPLPAYNINTISPLPLSPTSPLSHSFVQRKADLNLFKDFWDAYPRKTAKGSAEKAWAKAILRTSGSEIIQIVKRVKWPDDPEFVPHPSTWLNQRRWEDEGPKREITQEERDERARVYLRSIGRNV
jgi:hypothetical protein